ncbi:hypothetical protein AU074_13615 [Pseudomonas sp. ATCC PTA-122608]|uniref:hypothetical protein n=1 Tax=Pseudomonas sp. ATCC PTA-122608 TaxID=1771311 RepID=UPI00096BB45C|nr:hypothetical protein [Pseudomonas sp. ATCC PTA-122608]OLY72208.1 hypothetical protein AU074_13615 [Pseudomonas sp. ATCC PTA-122608]
MNQDLKESTNRYLNMSLIMVLYGMLSVFQVGFYGTFTNAKYLLKYVVPAMAFPMAMVIAIGLTLLAFTKIDNACNRNRAGKSTTAELNVYRLMGLYKGALALIALCVTYRFAIVHFYGVNFFDFAIEQSWTEQAYTRDTVRDARRAFFSSSQNAMYISLYSFLLVYVVGGTLGYAWLKGKADEARRVVSSGIVARTAY